MIACVRVPCCHRCTILTLFSVCCFVVPAAGGFFFSSSFFCRQVIPLFVHYDQPTQVLIMTNKQALVEMPSIEVASRIIESESTMKIRDTTVYLQFSQHQELEVQLLFRALQVAQQRHKPSIHLPIDWCTHL